MTRGQSDVILICADPPRGKKHRDRGSRQDGVAAVTLYKLLQLIQDVVVVLLL